MTLIWSRRLVLGTFMLLLTGASAHADDTTKRAKIEELFSLMNMQKTMDQVIDQSARQGAQTAMSLYPNVKLTVEQKKALDEGLQQVNQVTHEALAWSKLDPEFTKLYADNYSEETVDGLLAFYRSPAGQEMLSKQSVLMTQASAIVQRAAVIMQPQLQAIMQQMQQKMQKAAAPAK